MKGSTLDTAASRGIFATGGFGKPEEYVGYKVHDPEGRKVGRVKELFANAHGEPEYVRVRMGFFGLRLYPKTSL